MPTVWSLRKSAYKSSAPYLAKLLSGLAEGVTLTDLTETHLLQNFQSEIHVLFALKLIGSLDQPVMEAYQNLETLLGQHLGHHIIIIIIIQLCKDLWQYIQSEQ